VREDFREGPGDLVKLVDIWRYFDRKAGLFSESRDVLEGPCGVYRGTFKLKRRSPPPFFISCRSSVCQNTITLNEAFQARTSSSDIEFLPI
jgi:hypothetical protein